MKLHPGKRESTNKSDAQLSRKTQSTGERERLTEETQLKVRDDEHKINDVYFVDQPYILSGYVV